MDLQVRTINADLGHFNDLEGDRDELTRAFLEDLHLAQAVGPSGWRAGCGVPTAPNDIASDIRVVVEGLREFAAAAADEGLVLMVEAPYHFRLCNTVPVALELIERIDHLNATLVFDTSHLRASGVDIAEAARLFGDWITHIHLRNAVPGNINLPIGAGDVNVDALFETLAEMGYNGHFTLEPETGVTDKNEKIAQVQDGRARIETIWSTRRSYV